MTAPFYLDHAATTPMVPAAVEAMVAEFAQVGNASSLHASGRRARRVVEESRELAHQIHVDSHVPIILVVCHSTLLPPC